MLQLWLKPSSWVPLSSHLGHAFCGRRCCCYSATCARAAVAVDTFAARLLLLLLHALQLLLHLRGVYGRMHLHMKTCRHTSAGAVSTRGSKRLGLQAAGIPVVKREGSRAYKHLDAWSDANVCLVAVYSLPKLLLPSLLHLLACYCGHPAGSPCHVLA